MTTTQSAEKATLTISNIHPMIQGDNDFTFKKLQKKNKLKLVNSDINPKLQHIPLKDLTPLESQRSVNSAWIKKRVEARGGLDMFALGALEVCKDTTDGKFYVWNGNGRFGIATYYAFETLGENAGHFNVPCLVVESTKEEAAFYFNYNQSEGRRNLSQEILFVNRYFSQDADALREASKLSLLGLYIQKDSEMSVPENPAEGSIKISYRAFHEGSKLAKGDIHLQLLARDMVVDGFTTLSRPCTFINQDIWFALIKFLVIYPEAKTNGLNKSIREFLKAIGNVSSQDRIDWKDKGLSGNKGVAPQLAYGFLKAFKTSIHWKGQYSNTLTFKRLENFINLTDEDQMSANND